MKYIKYLVLFLLISNANNLGLSQDNTFSKLYPLEPFPAANFNAVLVTDTAYFMIGVVSDSLPPYGPKPLFVRTDIDGNIEVIKVHYDGIKNYETWFQGLFFDDSGRLVTNGYIFNNPDKKGVFFIRYTQNGNVDTIIEFGHNTASIEITNPMMALKNKNYIMPVKSKPAIINFTLNNKGIVIDKTIYNPNNSNFLLIRMDTTKNGYILGGWQAPAGPVKNGINQTIIVEFDSLGNKIWEYESPIDEDWCGTLGGIVSNDKDEIIYVSGQGYIYDPQTVSDYFNFKWYATKLDKSKNIVWRTLIPSTTESPAEICRFWNIIKLKDQKSYITMGMDFLHKPKHFGWLAKFNDDGELLWNRRYNVEDKNSTYYEIKDMAEDDDGNLIGVGERLFYDTSGLNTQQAWLMKLDQYGCLVPGCHLVGTSQVEKEKVAIKVFPNPASEFISFYIKDNIGIKNIQYWIRDISGNMFKEDKLVESETNYIIQTHDFPSGMYIIQFLLDNQIVQSEKFIVSH